MKKNILLPLLILLGSAASISLWGAKPLGKKWETEALKRKAEYIYMQSLNEELNNDKSSYYLLLKRALELDPSNTTVGYESAIYDIPLIGEDDTTARDAAVARIKTYFEENTDDIYAGLRYALIVQSLGDSAETARVYELLHSRFPERTALTDYYARVLASFGTEKSINRALELYDTLELIDGISPDLSMKKINVMMMRRDTAAVLNEARRVQLAAPAHVENNVFLADIYGAFQMNDSALAYYNRACALDPSSAEARYSRAGFYNAIGDSVAFDHEIFEVLKMDDLDMNVKLGVLRDYVGALYSDTLQRPRILDIFETMTELHPMNTDLRRFYASYLILIGRYADGAAQQSRALDLDPASEEGWGVLISAYAQADDTVACLKTIDRALSYYPANPKFYQFQGHVYVNEKQYDKAMDSYYKAFEHTDSTDYEERSVILTGIGDVLQMIHRADSAIAVYQRAILIDPFNYIAMNNLAYFLAEEDRDLEQARQLIERVVARDNKEATWLDTYAWVLFKQKEYQEARKQMDITLQLMGDVQSSDVLHHAGDIYFMDGDPDKALELWKKALTLDPENELLQRKVKHKTYFYK